ncbi:MAG: diacylglycerol kinase family protein [Patescibacteria group bacterium]
MSVIRFIQSLKDAWHGVKFVFKHEQNFRVQTFVAIAVVLAGWYFRLSKPEWILVIFLILSVITLEFLNSAVEKLSDILKPRLDYQVEAVKDIMAGVVFLTSLGAIVIGVIIFWPHLIFYVR